MSYKEINCRINDVNWADDNLHKPNLRTQDEAIENSFELCTIVNKKENATKG